MPTAVSVCGWSVLGGWVCVCVCALPLLPGGAVPNHCLLSRSEAEQSLSVSSLLTKQVHEVKRGISLPFPFHCHTIDMKTDWCHFFC